MNKYLVTGATGALGQALVSLLAAEGKDIRVFVRDTAKFRRIFPDLEVEIVQGDILNFEDVQKAVVDITTIFNCVNFPLNHYKPTVTANEFLVKAASPYGSEVVYPANTWVFGKLGHAMISPELAYNPTTPLARIEARAIEVLSAAKDNYGIAATIVHLPDFYGPNVVNDLVTPIFENALKGHDTHFPGPIDEVHDFIYIEDAARALLSVAGNRHSFWQVYTVGGPGPLSVREFGKLVYQAAGIEGQVHGMPVSVLRLDGLINSKARAEASVMYVFSQDVHMDGTLFKNDTGFVPQVSYEEGIRRTLEWMKASTALLNEPVGSHS